MLETKISKNESFHCGDRDPNSLALGVEVIGFSWQGTSESLSSCLRVTVVVAGILVVGDWHCHLLQEDQFSKVGFRDYSDRYIVFIELCMLAALT
jgi:hypothetical protein